MVGILLPPSTTGAIVNYAAMLSGRVPVNLNYTLSDQALASCIRQCEIQTVITSKAFLEKVKIRIPCEAVCLEDVVGKGFEKDRDSEMPGPSAFCVGKADRCSHGMAASCPAFGARSGMQIENRSG